VAAQAGGTEQAISAIDRLDEIFLVAAAEMRRDVYVAAARGNLAPQELADLALKVADAGDRAFIADRFDLAKELSDVAAGLARRSANAQLLKDLTARIADMRAKLRESAAYQMALATLAEKPTDPDANLVVGKFRCMIQGDFAAGLKNLAQSSDPALKALAAAELASPTAANDQAKLGDSWMDLADKEKDFRKAVLQARAKHWYESALPSLKGLGKAKVEARLQELTKADIPAPSEAPPKVVAGGKKTSAKGKIYVAGDDTFELAHNGKVIARGNHKEETIDIEVKVGDLLIARAVFAEYEWGFSLLFLSDDKRQVFFTNLATWRDCAPADPTKWSSHKPSPQDGPTKLAHRNSLRIADGAGQGYGVDAIWGFNPQTSFLYHVVTEQDLEVLADPPLKASKRGVAIAGKIMASGDDMFDLAVNGKPILSGRNTNEASAAVELRVGDQIAVRVINTQYEGGFACAFASEDGKVAFYSNPANWIAYQPSDGQRWWKLRGNEPTAPVKPGTSNRLVIPPAHVAGATIIWSSDNKISSGYILHVVTEQDLRKRK
jgi:hypothetical protein